MPMPAYMTVKGQKQGEIKGSCTQKGREDMILVCGFHSDVTIPTDPHTGMPSGKRVHKPLVVTTEFDKSTPLLYQACVTGESLTDVFLKFFKIGKDGKESNYFNIELTNGTIVDMKSYFPITHDKEKAGYGNMVEISFVYQKIAWRNIDGKTEAQDDWQVPV